MSNDQKGPQAISQAVGQKAPDLVETLTPVEIARLAALDDLMSIASSAVKHTRTNEGYEFFTLLTKGAGEKRKAILDNAEERLIALDVNEKGR